MEIQAFICKVHLDALIDQVAQARPIFQIPGAPIDLVNDEPIDLSSSEKV